MSIAVSALIKPSKILHNALIFFAAGSVVISTLVVLNQLNTLGPIPQIAIAGAWVVWLALIFRLFQGGQKAVRLDISGVGQIRLTSVTQTNMVTNSPAKNCASELFKLLPDSTLWAQLIILRLKSETGKIKVLIVLPDSLEDDGFRVLSVACRWIAAHNNPDKRTNL